MSEQPDPKAMGGPVDPSRYQFADSDFGCTLFVPRKANGERSEAILKHAMAWYRREGGATS